MRYISLRRAALSGFALLFSLWVCSVCVCAEQAIVIKVTSLKGAANVTKPDGTAETLTDTSKPIALPATIELAGAKGSFRISLPTVFTGKFNAISWTMRQGEMVRVSLLQNNKGVRFEYLKGTRKFYLNVNTAENLMEVVSVTGTTTVLIPQNTVTVREKDSALLTMPTNLYSSISVNPGQVSEVQFSYSPTALPPRVEGLPLVPEPERIEQSPYRP